MLTMIRGAIGLLFIALSFPPLWLSVGLTKLGVWIGGEPFRVAQHDAEALSERP